MWNEISATVEQHCLEELEQDNLCIYPLLYSSFLPEETP